MRQMLGVQAHVCPKCGYCDCCGRGGHPYPYKTYPWHPPYVYWYGSGTADFTVYNEGRVNIDNTSVR